MLLVTVVLVVIQLIIAATSPMRFIYFALWLQTMPYTWNFDSQLVYETPIGPLNVVAMQMFGFCLACLLVIGFNLPGAAQQMRYAKWHLVFLGFCVLSMLYAPSTAYALRMMAKLLGPFCFLIAILAVVRSEDEIRKMRGAFLGSGMVLLTLAFVARASGISSDPNAIETGMSGLGPPSMGPPVFSAHMLPVAMLALATFLAERRSVMLVMAIASALAILGALQRTSAGALYIGFSIILFAGTRGMWRLLLPAAGLVGLPALVLFSAPFRHRMFFGDATSEQLLADPLKAANSVNGSGRFDLWDNMQRRFFEPNPLIGSGLGSTQEYFYARTGGGVVHSEYVRLMCEVGLVGLALFLAALAAYLWRVQKYCRRTSPPVLRAAGLAALGGIITYAMYCATDNAFDYVTQFGIYVFGLVAVAIKADELRDTIHETVRPDESVRLFPNLMP